MRRLISIIAMAALALSQAAAQAPEIKQYKDVKPTKNVILMIPDGVSTSELAICRRYKQLLEMRGEEKAYEGLATDPYMCGMVQTFCSDSPIAASPAAISAIATGIPAQANNLSIYPQPNPGQDIWPVDASKAGKPAMTVLEAAKKVQGKSTGLVVTVDFFHATPAGLSAHAAYRYDNDKIITDMINNDLDVMFGGGYRKLTDEYRSMIRACGTELIEKDAEAFRNFNGDKLWAIFTSGNMSYDLDRNPKKEPSLEEMTVKALDMLSRNKKGFFLMVEGSKVDYAGHANDPVGVVTEYLAFDKAVKVAMDWAQKDGNTTVIVLPDHGNSGMTIGCNSYEHYYQKGIDSVFVGMPLVKKTSAGIEKALKKAKPEEFRKVFKELTSIDITSDEEAALIAHVDDEVKDYMKAALEPTLQYEVSRILLSRVHLSVANSTHTGEDVYLAAYHPKGCIPTGTITCVDLNMYLQRVLGLKKPLSEYTPVYFE